MCIQTGTGRTALLSREGGDDLLQISSAEGQVEMEVRFTDAGPVLRFPSAALRLEADQDVDLSCGDFRLRADGSVDIRAAESARLEGHGVEIRSRRTDVRLHANDDVRVDGERILLNC